jgi:hypothetical protein
MALDTPALLKAMSSRPKVSTVAGRGQRPGLRQPHRRGERAVDGPRGLDILGANALGRALYPESVLNALARREPVRDRRPVPPNSRASAIRSWRRPMMMICSAPSRFAAMTAHRPTAPSPTIAARRPGPTLATTPSAAAPTFRDLNTVEKTAPLPRECRAPVACSRRPRAVRRRVRARRGGHRACPRDTDAADRAPRGARCRSPSPFDWPPAAAPTTAISATRRRRACAPVRPRPRRSTRRAAAAPATLPGSPSPGLSDGANRWLARVYEGHCHVRRRRSPTPVPPGTGVEVRGL